MSWPVMVLAALFIASSMSSLYQTWSSPVHKEGYVGDWREKRLESDYTFLGAGILIPIVGWILGTSARRSITEAIRASSKQVDAGA